MTDEEYRGQGLCRALMERVIKEWEDKCDLIYLLLMTVFLILS